MPRRPWRAPAGALAKLVAAARSEGAARHRNLPRWKAQLADRPAKPGGRLLAALRNCRDRFPLLCEIKRASPSAGAIASGASATARARLYQEAGAAAVSVLTERVHFGGSIADLRRTRTAVTVPLLRKDFIVDTSMVYQSAAAGADAILLIAAALEPETLLDLNALAIDLGLDVLLEIGHARELDLLSQRPFPLVGINGRDLETLRVDRRKFESLAPAVRQTDRLLVAESGIQNPEDIRRVHAAGATAALVGEALMRAADPAALVQALGTALT